MDACTGLIGLFGHPVAHSLSPAFMNEALKTLGENCVYLAFDVEEPSLGDAVRSMRPLKWRGANVTIPHKQAAVEFLDGADEDARTIGAVNCIVNRDGSLLGRNTDHLGFRDTLAGMGFGLDSVSAALIGCGGAARGVLFALVRGGAGKVFLVNRTESRARELAAWAERALGFGGVEYVGSGPFASREQNRANGRSDRTAYRNALAEAGLVVNTTPVGMLDRGEGAGAAARRTPNLSTAPLGPGIELRRGALVFDLVYNPPETPLLAWARAEGASTVNGLPMLVHQGLRSLAHWFPGRGGEIFPLAERLLGVCERALRRRREAADGA